MSDTPINPTSVPQPVTTGQPPDAAPAPVETTVAQDLAADVASFEKDTINGAIDFLKAALEAAAASTPVKVGQVTGDIEDLAFKVAKEKGFDAYLALFKDAIDKGTATVSQAISDQTVVLIHQGITYLEAQKKQ